MGRGRSGRGVAVVAAAATTTTASTAAVWAGRRVHPGEKALVLEQLEEQADDALWVARGVKGLGLLLRRRLRGGGGVPREQRALDRASVALGFLLHERG